MRRPTRRTVLLAAAAVIIAAAIGAAAVVKSLHESAILETTGNRNLTMIAVALQNYHQDYSSLPPAFTTDRNGKRMNSWRVLLLPYIGSKELFRQWDFASPWNSPKNLPLTSPTPMFYRCPTNADTGTKPTTCVVVFDGGRLWPGSKPGKLTPDGFDMDEILLIEIAHSDILWMEPRDMTANEALEAIRPERSTSIGGPSVVAYMTVFGEIRRLATDADRRLLRTRLGEPQKGRGAGKDRK